MSDNLVVFEIFIANICVSKLNVLIIIKIHFNSLKYNKAKNVIEKALTLSKISVINDDLTSSKKSENSKSKCNDSSLINIKNNKRITTKSKRYFENELKTFSCDVVIKNETNQFIFIFFDNDNNIRKRRKIQKIRSKKQCFQNFQIFKFCYYR